MVQTTVRPESTDLRIVLHPHKSKAQVSQMSLPWMEHGNMPALRMEDTVAQVKEIERDLL